MDIKRGYCWRCEKKMTNPTPCSACGVAKYCTQKCCDRDQWRHKQECENWKPRQCFNCNSSGQLLECSGCCDAWYCGGKCQKAHWKRHKSACHERTQEIKEAVPKMGSSFNYMSGTPLLAPYYIGNALAIDMLNLSDNECCAPPDGSETNTDSDPLTREYSILSCGCGNLRNWILTAASLPSNFSGKLHTTLNDFDPYMQARNVLHLYLMIVHQDEDGIADSIASIWYSLHLSEKDYKLLMDCLTALQGLTACDLKRITKGILTDIKDEDLILMREVWEMWTNLECRKGQPKYINLQKQRQELMMKRDKDIEGQEMYRDGLPKTFLPSYNKHCQTGDFYGSGKQQLLYDNPTITGYLFPKNDTTRFDIKRAERIAALLHPKQHPFVYCIQPDLSVFFEWDFLQVKNHHYNKSLVVMFHSYISEQIKQVISRLKTDSLSVAIDVWNCVELGTRLDTKERKFDRIFTSNIADYSGTQALLKALKPSLNEANKCSAIFTQHWNWYGYFPLAMIGGPPGSDSMTRAAAIMSCGIDGTHDMYADNDRMQVRLKNPLVMMQESKKVVDKEGVYYSQEYFNSMIWFVSYLRADLMTFDGPQSKAPPSYQKVKNSQGLILQDFRRGELNKVTPHRLRRNVRTINLMRGMERVLEWHLPT